MARIPHSFDLPVAAVAAGKAPPMAEIGSDHRAGAIVGEKYRLIRKLGQGGMAEVWLASHEALRSRVAIKFVARKLAHDREAAPAALERFRFEAQISARLAAATRHVVAVHDVGVHEGAPFCVMELVPGRTLEEEIERVGAIPPERFAAILDQIADALRAAHAIGVVHRDVKPSNVMLVDATSDPYGEPSVDTTVDEPRADFVKVSDFGVAKALRRDLPLDRPRETLDDDIVGSPAFMSPEQLEGRVDVGPASDLFSLGVVAYEALTGKACFDGRSVPEIMVAISVGRYKPASRVRPELPATVDAWLARALAVDPKKRFASAEEMARAFRAAISREAVVASRARRGLAAAIVAAVVTGGAAGLVLFGRGRAEEPAESAQPAVTATASATVSAAPTITVVEAPPAVTATARQAPPIRVVATAAPTATTAAPAATTAAPAATTAAPVVTTTAPPPPKKRMDPSEIQ